MKLLEKLFSEKSDISIMRIMAISSLIMAAGLAIAGHDATVISIFVYAAFGGKVAQRFVESKEN